MNAKEEITKLIRASYDQGAKDAQQETLAALEQIVAAARADEREACAKLAQETICDTHTPTGVNIYGTRAAKAIRARGEA
jgi:hypothetical protein